MNAWLEKFPSTNARIFVSIVLSAFYVGGAMILSYIQKAPPEHVLYILGGYLLLMSGLDVGQFLAKRSTFKPEPEPAPAAVAPSKPGPLTPMSWTPGPGEVDG